MRLMIQTLAFALLALVAIAPTSAAKRDKTAFTVDIDAVLAGTGQWEGQFKARGAINDRGRVVGPWNTPVLPGRYSLVGNVRGSLSVVIDYGDLFDLEGIEEGEYDFTGTFLIEGTSGDHAGLSGSGTATGRLTVRVGELLEVRWHLDGTLDDS